ncbi:MAG TPA: selenocysteine-specific translation elongation factor [Candidatus Acidoferrum sp.]|jgi:selenocysteine-specific elongation factor|nr:selenocysteine-specific translation elongation factor [Candidatus Acidoferrum sp.]
MNPGSGFVVGTAGHIDHGKSTLITALTGIDPDRLAEEKRRGMTIDLGFAHMVMPSGREIGIIDVPGHARFMRNMLAGAHGLDAVLLVVAADEGVMPQTREHLEIVDLLEVRRGIVVLTKADLVDDAWLELVTGEVRETTQGTALAGAEVIPVSALGGQGLPILIKALDVLLDGAEPRSDLGRPRLPIDRVFTMSGFGTVVTGTLVDGTLSVGDEVEVVPRGRLARIRGLQRHNHSVQSASPGMRVAVNLTGLDKADVARGDVLAPPETLPSTRRVDAHIRVLASSPRALRHGAEVLLHTGTVEVGCRVIVLAGDAVEPGHDAWVQLYLERAIAAGINDRFVLRVPSPAVTVAGGRFVDVDPRKHPRHDQAVSESLERRASGEGLQEELRKYPRGVSVVALVKATMASELDIRSLEAKRFGDWIIAIEAWRLLAERATQEVSAYHAAHPLRPGMAREELRNRLRLHASSFPAALAALVAEGTLEDRQGALSTPDHRVAIDGSDGPAGKLLELLGRAPFAPPSLPDAMQQSGAGPEVVRALAQSGAIVRLSDDIAFTRDGYSSAVGIVKELIATTGSVTVAQVRDRMGASRRPVLALLEHLDGAKVTRRVGDQRILFR